MKKKQRKTYTSALKVKIALEAIKGQRTINEIATHYDVHPNQVTQWKKQICLAIRIYLYGARASAAVERDESLWQSWMNERFQAAGAASSVV